MVDRINFTSPVQPAHGNRPGTANEVAGGKNFAQTLAQVTQRQDALRLSSHAQKRLDSSQVTLTEAHMERIGGAVDRATQKGSNQSLIMLDDLALVVSVKNRVVITAVDDARMKDSVFTNIDSVVIA
jgi:flagellar operon protein